MEVKKAKFSNAAAIVFDSEITEFIPEGSSENYKIRIICEVIDGNISNGRAIIIEIIPYAYTELIDYYDLYYVDVSLNFDEFNPRFTYP